MNAASAPVTETRSPVCRPCDCVVTTVVTLDVRVSDVVATPLLWITSPTTIVDVAIDPELAYVKVVSVNLVMLTFVASNPFISTSILTISPVINP